MIAVYGVAAAKVESDGIHRTDPVYWAVSVIAVTGVAPVTGGVTPAMVFMSIGPPTASSVLGNTAVTTVLL